jgi:UDP-N-acetylmuramate dehydrogenase
VTIDEAVMRALAAVAPVRRDEALSRHTTIGIGGPADAYVTARSAGELSGALRVAQAAGVPVFVLGSGSNIVVGDRGIRGVVIENRASGVTSPPSPLSPSTELRTGLRGEGEVSSSTSSDRVEFRIESGASFAAVARQLAFAGYAGLEWACGIPGTLGGAVVYNAGAYGGCLGDVLQRIAVWDVGVGEVVYEAPELGLVYRGSAFTRGLMAGRAVLWADVALWQGDIEALKGRVADYDARRLKAQPRGRNAGSFFKNPAGQPAWRLLDAVGLRGYRAGGAEFSDKHCNFLINAGGATAADVMVLMSLAQDRVRERFGIELENEVTLVGEGFGR